MVLEEEQRLLDDRIETDDALRDRLGAAEVEQPVDDRLAALNLVVDDLQVVSRLGRHGDTRCGEILHPQRKAFGAGRDGGERVVDLVHDSRGECAYRGELLGLGKTLLGLLPDRKSTRLNS